jgi:general secretion pathway protein F
VPLYRYKATTLEEELREGILEGVDKEHIVSQLEAEGLVPLSVTPHKRISSWKEGFFSFLIRRKVPTKSVASFAYSLSTLVAAGLPLDRALRITVQVSEGEKMRSIIRRMLVVLEEGAALSEALAQFPEVFHPLFVNMVRVGEAGGALSEVLARVAEHLERVEEFRGRLVSSLVYPVVLAVVSILSIVVLIVFVIPRFSVVFETLGQSLPLSMKFLTVLGRALSSYWWLFVLLAVFVLVFWKRRVGTAEGKLWWDGLKLRIPMLGKILKGVEGARFARNFGLLLNNGVPLLQALSVTGNLMSNSLFKREIAGLYDGVREGERLSRLMTGRGDLWHPLIVGLAEVGEESGTLGYMLLKAADNIERGIEEKVRRAVALVEPATIVFMGLVVGFIVVSMLMAIFSINDVVF